MSILSSENVVEKQVSSIVKRLKARKKGLDTQLDVVTDEIDELVKQVETLEEEQTGLQTSLDTLQTSIDDLEKSKEVLSEAL